MRSREVSVSIILQNLAQLKALFEKQWESIVGNCDEFLYLGGNEQGTHKYVSELLGKSTIDMNTYGKSTGHMGNYSTNYQISGRELLTPDEVRMLDNRYALLFIRGERPIMDEKFDILKHPNLALTPDGDGEAYRHGEVTQAVASISLGNSLKNEVKLEQTENIVLELLSEEDLLGVETNITNWQRRQNANNNFSAVVPYDMEQQRKESKEFLDDLTTRDQRMMFAVLTLVHTAESKEQLDSDTDPRSPNEILEPEYSIYCGVLELKDCLIENEVENPIDIENIRLALQQYNAEVEEYDSLVLQYYIYGKNLIESHI
jgi:type IV secretion system protein VirD4